MGASPPMLSLFAMLLILTTSLVDSRIFNVVSYGADPYGRIDSEHAFVKAWEDACDYEGQRSVLLVPKGTFTFKHVLLTGPCKAQSIVFQLNGDLQAVAGYYGRIYWLTFQYVNNLLFTGKGTLDGQGHTTWHHNDCQTNPNCGPFPTNLRFDMVNNSVIRDVTSFNSKSTHINIFGSNNVNVTNVNIVAPADSPNTDGIHLGGAHRIRITDSRIATGDDCISFSPGTHVVGVHRVVCGVGHGISIGSLGGNDGEVVTRIHVKDSTFMNTENGVRVKTWPDSKTGIVDTIVFENIVMKNVGNPIIIDQEYCPTSCNLQVPSKVQVRNIKFNNIYGTSSTKIAVNLKCSRDYPCKNVQLKDINLTYNKVDYKTVMQCLNVQGGSQGHINPQSCL